MPFVKGEWVAKAPARGIHAFVEAGHAVSIVSPTSRLLYYWACAYCGWRPPYQTSMKNNALGRAAREKAAIRRHVIEKHPQKLQPPTGG